MLHDILLWHYAHQIMVVGLTCLCFAATLFFIAGQRHESGKTSAAATIGAIALGALGAWLLIPVDRHETEACVKKEVANMGDWGVTEDLAWRHCGG